MATRSALSRLTVTRSMKSTLGATRYFSDGKGRVLSEEERAAENVYIKKMEKERLEKLKQKAEKEKLQKEKEDAEKVFPLLQFSFCRIESFYELHIVVCFSLKTIRASG
ncbi:IATP domain-containing protein [Cephalotus follicularis]|uniref:IATP domain-containing protein n=1 Tax=Cephalotus follicularis TaxID=3775 RepID=A0A1Q3BX27_CEPFO|nr:IATP domain-containing protein [Cephalotus follicularis]